MNTCCNKAHPFDSRNVKTSWWPKRLRCLIIGESPGNPTSLYFYDPIPQEKKDPVGVRSQLLRGLCEIGLLTAPILENFKEEGFLFDHGIRCPLSLKSIIEKERQLAQRFKSSLAHRANYLKEEIALAEKVWVMGHVARDAVLHQLKNQGQETHEPLKSRFTPPFQTEKFFFSRYLTRCPLIERKMIWKGFKDFLLNET